MIGEKSDEFEEPKIGSIFRCIAEKIILKEKKRRT